eukprot:gene16955-23230_t
MTRRDDLKPDDRYDYCYTTGSQQLPSAPKRTQNNAKRISDKNTRRNSNRNLRSRAIYDCTNPAVPFYPIYLAPAIGARPGGTHADISFSARAFRPPQPPLLAFLAGLVLLGACQAQSSLILSYIDFDYICSVDKGVVTAFWELRLNTRHCTNIVGKNHFTGSLMKNALALERKQGRCLRAMGIPKSIPTSTWQTLGEAAQNFPAKYLLQLPLKALLCQVPPAATMKARLLYELFIFFEYVMIHWVESSLFMLLYTGTSLPRTSADTLKRSFSVSIFYYMHFSAKYLLQLPLKGEELSASVFYYMHFSAKYLLQLPLKMTNRPKSEWDASKYKGIDMLEAANRWIGSDKILGFPLGNEPDWFVHNRGWDKEWYFRVNGDYDSGSAKSSGYTYDNLLSNEILYGAMATAQEMVGVAIKEQADYRVTETGSLYGGGRWGMSDRFGAALWMLEVSMGLAFRGTAGVNFNGVVSMGLAFRGTAGVNFNGVGCSPNALVMVGDCSEQLHFDKLGPGFRPNPTYYGMLMFQRALGSGARISQLVTNNGGLNMGTWGFNPTDADSWDKRRVVVINRERWKSGRVSITLTGSYRPAATVCQLTASTTKTPRENATAGRVTICGQQVNAQGELTPTNPKFDWVDGVESWSSEINKQMTTFTFWMESVTAVVLEATLKW